MDNKLIENQRKFKEEYSIGYTTKILENIITKFNLYDFGHSTTKDSEEVKNLVINLDKYNNNKLNVKIVTIVKAQMMRIINNELDAKEVEITKGFTLCSKESKELEDLIETANKKNLMIFEAMNLHYTPAFLSLKEDLKKLGDIKIVSFNYSQYSSRYNAFKEGTILPAFDFHKAGGALMDLNVYNIHALIDLFGEPVYHKYMANIERNIDTSGMMIFDFEHFKALCIGAKDCKAPLMNTIQGNLGAIVVKCPLSQMTEYEICYNDGTSEIKSFEKKHRLIYEFKEFMRMIKENDVKKQKEMLELSLLISKLMEEGRMQEGIVFDNDK